MRIPSLPKLMFSTATASLLAIHGIVIIACYIFSFKLLIKIEVHDSTQTFNPIKLQGEIPNPLAAPSTHAARMCNSAVPAKLLPGVK